MNIVFKNYTPHDINLIESGKVTTLKSEGIARCDIKTEKLSPINNIPVVRKSYGNVVGLPDCEEGVFYIVSNIVASACPNRYDLLVPDNLVRDNNGAIIGCTSFSIIWSN